MTRPRFLQGLLALILLAVSCLSMSGCWLCGLYGASRAATYHPSNEIRWDGQAKQGFLLLGQDEYTVYAEGILYEDEDTPRIAYIRIRTDGEPRASLSETDDRPVLGQSIEVRCVYGPPDVAPTPPCLVLQGHCRGPWVPSWQVDGVLEVDPNAAVHFASMQFDDLSWVERSRCGKVLGYAAYPVYIIGDVTFLGPMNLRAWILDLFR